jgi:hypothetical protein
MITVEGEIQCRLLFHNLLYMYSLLCANSITGWHT